MVGRRFDIWLVKATHGQQQSSPSPAVVISPDELNRHLNTVIIAPLTRTHQDYPTRIMCTLGDQTGQIALEELHTITETHLIKRIGTLPDSLTQTLLESLHELFAA